MKSRSFEDLARQKPGLFSEKRIYLKSGTSTRLVRLKTRDQIIAWAGGTLLVGWTTAATALLAVHFINGDAGHADAKADLSVYETRVNALATERDRRLMEARAAQEQFSALLTQLGDLQDRIFNAEVTSEERRAEAESLRDRLYAALDQASQAAPALSAEGGADSSATLNVMTDALADLADEREALAQQLAEAQSEIADLMLQSRLDAERNDRIFAKLEEAVTVSIEPLDKMFSKVGLNSNRLLDTMRSRYNGQGGPLTPIAFSTKGDVDADTARANNVLSHMQELNLYRMAVDALPMAMPVDAGVRQTSTFGYRRDPILGGARLHEGVDWAGAYGTPVMATADGVVVHAGWSTGYGRLVKIQHEFGIETRYAHLSKLNVKVGQKVSRGDKIGAMGNSGRSTGTHLHYEVRLGGKATDPMTYITAARDVF